MLLRLVPRLEAAFSGVKIRLRGDAGFAPPVNRISKQCSKNSLAIDRRVALLTRIGWLLCEMPSAS